MIITDRSKDQGANWESWLREVNWILEEALGLSDSDAVKEFPWREFYEEDSFPSSSIEEAISFWEEDSAFSGDSRGKFALFERSLSEPGFLSLDRNSGIVHWIEDNRPLCGAIRGEDWGMINWPRPSFFTPNPNNKYKPCSICQSMILGNGENTE